MFPFCERLRAMSHAKRRGKPASHGRIFFKSNHFMSHPALISFHVANEWWQLPLHMEHHHGRYVGPLRLGWSRPVEGPPRAVTCNLGWGRGLLCPSHWVLWVSATRCQCRQRGKGEEREREEEKTAWHEFRKLSSSHIWFLYFKVN